MVVRYSKKSQDMIFSQKIFLPNPMQNTLLLPIKWKFIYFAQREGCRIVCWCECERTYIKNIHLIKRLESVEIAFIILIHSIQIELKQNFGKGVKVHFIYFGKDAFKVHSSRGLTQILALIFFSFSSFMLSASWVSLNYRKCALQPCWESHFTYF